jgi:hypothetical protein
MFAKYIITIVWRLLPKNEVKLETNFIFMYSLLAIFKDHTQMFQHEQVSLLEEKQYSLFIFIFIRQNASINAMKLIR